MARHSSLGGCLPTEFIEKRYGSETLPAQRQRGLEPLPLGAFGKFLDGLRHEGRREEVQDKFVLSLALSTCPIYRGHLKAP